MLGRHSSTILVAFIVALVTAGGPAVARTVVDFARNAGHVDGFNAVAPGDDHRDSALVATNAAGKLPTGIIPKVRKAADSDALGGLPQTAFVHDCGTGVIFGTALVPIDVPSTYSDVQGYGSFAGGAYNPKTAGCNYGGVQAEHAATGLYRVNLYGISLGCSGPPSALFGPVSALVTVNGTTRPLIANDDTVCDPQSHVMVEEVHIFDTTGAPQDASFTIAALNVPFAIP